MGSHTIKRIPKGTSKKTDAQAILDGIRLVVKALHVSSRACERASGRTSAQIFILERLAEHGRLSVNELAERTFTHQSTVSVVVGRLIADGLVARTPSKTDGRRLELTLTPKGVRANEKSPQTAQRALAAAIEKLPPAKRKLLGKLFHELVDLAGFAQARPSLFFEDDQPE